VVSIAVAVLGLRLHAQLDGCCFVDTGGLFSVSGLALCGFFILITYFPIGVGGASLK
jgi:hypothetical protein